jgi:hypothetical protein
VVLTESDGLDYLSIIQNGLSDFFEIVNHGANTNG